MEIAVRLVLRLGVVFALVAGTACAELERINRPDPSPAPARETPADPAKSLSPEADTSKPETALSGDDLRVKGLRHTVRGSGKFIGKAPRRALARRGPDGGITLNFVNAEIAEVARAVLGGILSLNYAVDPAIKGAITLQTSRAIPRDAVLGAFENALNVAGAALVPGTDLYRIVPRAKAPTQGAPTTIAGDDAVSTAGYAVRIVPLRFVSAGEMAKILTPLAFKGTIIRVDSTRNLLILGAPAPELRSLEDMIAVFDVDWLAGLSLALVPLDFVNPEVLVKEIQEVLGKEKDDPLTGILRFVPLTRLNAVLVISTQPAYLRRAEDIIAKLDQGGSGTERQLFVYRVQNSDASQLAETLGRLFGATTGTTTTDVRGALAPQLEPARTTIRSGAQPSTQTSSAPSSTASTQSTGSTAASRARTGTTGGAAPRRTTGPGPAFTIDGTDQIRVVADKANNAILVWSTPADYRMVLSVLRKLDQIPLQVLIEATIAEVTLNETLRYGVQWFFRSGDSSAFLTRAGDVGSLSDPSFAAFSGFTYFLNNANVKVILDALESVTDLNVISSPQLMVLDNQTATLQVGDQVPVLTQQLTTAEDSVTNTVEYRDTGIILNVTPRVNVGGLVSMQIEQEASLVSEDVTTEGLESPTFRQRRITSTVAVQSGETVALGGLIQETRDRSESGIPGLRDIPGLGFFFGGKSNENVRTELLVLITPQVVRNQREVRRVTEELRKRLRTVIPLGTKIR
ncbi:MAG: type II secretion system secretin GspD [Alphaproteobacteria bacterium]|nr:type II secretion system secretin GspD [Alphaproteobacteria bacterium]